MSPLASYVVESLVTLLGVTALAVVVLFAARKAGVGRSSGPLELVGRLPLDARRAIYLVRAGARVYVLGASEAGLARLGELDAADVPAAPPEPRASFGDVLARVRGAPRARETGDAR